MARYKKPKPKWCSSVEQLQILLKNVNPSTSLRGKQNEGVFVSVVGGEMFISDVDVDGHDRMTSHYLDA